MILYKFVQLERFKIALSYHFVTLNKVGINLKGASLKMNGLCFVGFVRVNFATTLVTPKGHWGRQESAKWMRRHDMLTIELNGYNYCWKIVYYWLEKWRNRKSKLVSITLCRVEILYFLRTFLKNILIVFNRNNNSTKLTTNYDTFDKSERRFEMRNFEN